MAKFTWDKAAKRFRDSDSGKYLSQEKVESLVEASRVDAAKRLTNLADQMATESISLDEWEKQFRQIIKQESLIEYGVGRGGFKQMTQSDYGRVGRYLRDQYEYLRNFKKAVADLSDAQIKVRSQMYASASKYMYERARSVALDIPKLPAYPCDGTSECLINCGCGWDYQKLEGDGNWDCRWKKTKKESCPTCIDRADKWNPLQVRNGEIIA